MRSMAVRHSPQVSNRTLTLVSVAICLALLAAVLALIVVRRRARSRDLFAPIARETQEQRELRMSWTEVGAVAASDAKPIAPASAAREPNQSLPASVVPTNVTAERSQSCGLVTCGVGSTCCNPSCGICALSGEACYQRPCG
jgi:hypothetical protein